MSGEGSNPDRSRWLPKVNGNNTHGRQKHLAISKQNLRKSLRNLLTNSQIYDILLTKDEGKENPLKTRKEIIMKKATMNTILTALTAIDPKKYANEIAELTAELSKGQAQKDKNAEAYESIHSLIVEALSDTPVTCGELWESIEENVPDGITKGKVQYALTHLWQDEIVKIEGKPNTYRRA